MKRLVLLCVMLSLIGCSSNVDEGGTIQSEDQKVLLEDQWIQEIIFESDTLETFYEELFVKILDENPLWIDDLGDLSDYGVVFQKDLLNDVSEEQLLEQFNLYNAALVKLNAFKTDDINTKNVRWFLESSISELEYRNQSFFLSHIIGEPSWMYAVLLERHTIENKKDAEDWLARIKNSQTTIESWMSRYNNQIEAGYIMDPYSIDASISQLSTYFKTKAKYMDLYKHFVSKVESLEISNEDKTNLTETALLYLEDYYIPSMAELKQTLIDSKSISTESNGVWALPDGDDYYEFALRRHTTTDMTPDEVHQLGLSEVKRIREEMELAFSQLNYEGELSENLNALYKDATPYRGQAAMDEYKRVASELEADLESFFYKEDLPASSPTIEESPGGNFYVTPSIDGKRPGVYYLDLNGTHYDFTINTLAYHETVPGHHLEREHELLLKDMPMVRKLAFNTAYIEGWALYAEMLADENGYNNTPAHHIGYLKSELHRAARLVVDTGIHSKKWDRTQAVDYLVDEGLLHPGYAQAEVTRYTSWPGQACSYKIGQLKLLSLRNQMVEVLGDDFDIRDFHHLVLGNGSMPLILLEEYVLENIK